VQVPVDVIVTSGEPAAIAATRATKSTPNRRDADRMPSGGPNLAGMNMPSIDGVWNIDDSGRICASMVIGRAMLPLRYQYWFKHKHDYFVADSDSDPKAKLLRRTVKQ